jgi:ribosomal protein S18 acetylase RimI-like enzyme
MKIQEVTELTDEIVEAFRRLIPQLSSSTVAPTESELDEIVKAPATILLIARDASAQDAIVGTLTLVVYRIPTGAHAWIEDVVVDERARGKGVGEALCLDAIKRAAACGASALDLTSRPSREAANRLYRRLGFQLRETNVYRYVL